MGKTTFVKMLQPQTTHPVEKTVVVGDCGLKVHSLLFYTNRRPLKYNVWEMAELVRYGRLML